MQQSPSSARNRRKGSIYQKILLVFTIAWMGWVSVQIFKIDVLDERIKGLKETVDRIDRRLNGTATK